MADGPRIPMQTIRALSSGAAPLKTSQPSHSGSGWQAGEDGEHQTLGADFLKDLGGLGPVVDKAVCFVTHVMVEHDRPVS